MSLKPYLHDNIRDYIVLWVMQHKLGSFLYVSNRPRKPRPIGWDNSVEILPTFLPYKITTLCQTGENTKIFGKFTGEILFSIGVFLNNF